MKSIVIEKVWITDSAVWIRTVEGKEAHPELNASAIARRLGISQSLFAQYISGTKTPSAKRMEEILESIRSVGRELASLHVA